MPIPVHLRELDKQVMQETAAMILPDHCRIVRFVADAQDARGMPVERYVADAELTPCAFTDAGATERKPSGEQVVLTHARVRFGVGVSLDNRDRLIIEQRHGAADPRPLEQRTFALVRAPQVWQVGVTVELRRVDMPAMEQQP